MKKSAIVVVADVAQFEEVRRVLATDPYQIVRCESCSHVQGAISERNSKIVIFDLDTISVDNKSLRKLKTDNLGLSILVVSSKNVHPELRESLSTHIHACLKKPLDPEELRFWVRSITQDRPRKGPSP